MIISVYSRYLANVHIFADIWDIDIANLRYPAKNDKFFAGERRYSHTKRLVGISLYPSKLDLVDTWWEPPWKAGYLTISHSQESHPVLPGHADPLKPIWETHGKSHGISTFTADHCGLLFSHKSLLPSGKHTKNYGKSPLLMGKSTINGHFQ